jgi:hypothetical protein
MRLVDETADVLSAGAVAIGIIGFGDGKWRGGHGLFTFILASGARGCTQMSLTGTYL